MGWGRPGNEADLLVSKARLSVPVLEETGAASLGSRLPTFPLPPHTTAFLSLILSPPRPSLVALHDGLGMGLPPPFISPLPHVSSPSHPSPSHFLSLTLPLPHTLPFLVYTVVPLRTRLNEVALILKSVTVLISALRETQKSSSAKRELCGWVSVCGYVCV